MYTHMHTYIHARTHDTHTYPYTSTQRHINTYMHTYTETDTHIHSNTYTQTEG